MQMQGTRKVAASKHRTNPTGCVVAVGPMATEWRLHGATRATVMSKECIAAKVPAALGRGLMTVARQRNSAPRQQLEIAEIPSSRCLYTL